jgi:hypothetical protein
MLSGYFGGKRMVKCLAAAAAAAQLPLARAATKNNSIYFKW